MVQQHFQFRLIFFTSSQQKSSKRQPQHWRTVTGYPIHALIQRGSDAPCALGNLYSIGSISMESNGKIQSSVTDFLEEFGLEQDRMYINFFDMPRANVGWNRRTFAG